MTIDEFLERLATLRLEWNASTFIRCNHKGHRHCPISAVTGDAGDFGNPREAAQIKLGLSWDEADKIVAASDDWHRSDPSLRSRLLKACGLEEMA